MAVGDSIPMSSFGAWFSANPTGAKGSSHPSGIPPVGLRGSVLSSTCWYSVARPPVAFACCSCLI